MKTKQFLYVMSIAAASLAGCNVKPQCIMPPEENVNWEEDLDSYSFSKLSSGFDSTTIQAGQTFTLQINKDINKKNYVQMLIESRNSFVGKFVYCDVDDSSIVVSEDFYIEGSEEEIDFRQFFDAFRPNNSSYGDFQKTLLRIEFTNYLEEPIDVKVNKINISDRKVPSKTEIYIERDDLKVGADLLSGGTLTYLEKTSVDGGSVDCIVNSKDEVEIGVDIAGTGKSDISSNVNLINYYDAGRQIQQSFYASVGGYGSTEEEKKNPNNVDGGTQNGYTRNWCNTAGGYYWPYNPVQGGDEQVNFSQIIDYKHTRGEIYVKTRACDWAAGKKDAASELIQNRVTKSYMENWYTIKDGMLYTKNRFIDWNGFTDMDSIPAINLELPATYISHPLHVYQAYVGNKPWDDEEMEKNLNVDRKEGLSSWKNGSYRTSQHLEDWFAWTNKDDFGVAMYIPGATYYASGRSSSSTKIDDELNLNDKSPMAGKYRTNKQKATSEYLPCYTLNTSYTAPVKAVKMKEYVPFEYTYVISVDYLNYSREAFKNIAKGDNPITNEGMNAWDD